MTVPGIFEKDRKQKANKKRIPEKAQKINNKAKQKRTPEKAHVPLRRMGKIQFDQKIQ